MNLIYFIERMANNAKIIDAIVADVAVEQARWRPDANSWSMLEVIHHLYDEERLDFRTRLDTILHKPGATWPPIDPVGWVQTRNYNAQDFDTMSEKFQTERRKSLVWLRGLKAPDWEATYAAPFGLIKAGDMFAAWVAHDLLHTRQLIELRWAFTTQALEPYQVLYAGTW
ncbi:MAG: DinB family protein [Anaerolineales bacterium]|nr:DinB family protein [Anaerolineales bacterium]